MAILHSRTMMTKESVIYRMLAVLSVIFVNIEAVSGTFGPYYYNELPLEKCPTGSWAKSRCGGDFGECMPGFSCLPPNSIQIYPGMLPGICCPQIQTCPIGTDPGPLCGSKMKRICPVGYDCFNGVCCKSHVMLCPINSKPGGVCKESLTCKPGFFCYKGTCCSKPKLKSLCPPTYFPLKGLTCRHHIHCPGKAVCSNFLCCLRKKPLKKSRIPKKFPPKRKRPFKKPKESLAPPTKPRLPPDKLPKPILKDMQFPTEKVPKPIQKPKPRLPAPSPKTNVHMLFPPTEEPPINPTHTRSKIKLPPSCPMGYQHLIGLTCDHILSCPGNSRCISGVCCTKTDTGVCPYRYKPVEGINCNLRQRCPSDSRCVSGVCCLLERAQTCPPSYIQLNHLSCDSGACTGNGECIAGLCCAPQGIPVTSIPADFPRFNPTTLPTLSRFDAIPEPAPVVPPSSKPFDITPPVSPTSWLQPSTLPPLFLKSPTTIVPLLNIPVMNITDPIIVPSQPASPVNTTLTSPLPPLLPVYIPWDPLPSTPKPTIVTSKPFIYTLTTGGPFIPTFNPRSFNIQTNAPAIKQTHPPVNIPAVTDPVLTDIRLNTTFPPFIPTFNPKSFFIPTSPSTAIKQSNPPPVTDPILSKIRLNTTLPPFVPTFNPESFFIQTSPPTAKQTNPPPVTNPIISKIGRNTTFPPFFPTLNPNSFVMPNLPPQITNPSVINSAIPTNAPLSNTFQPSTPLPYFQVKDPLPVIESIIRPHISKNVSKSKPFYDTTIIPSVTSKPLHHNNITNSPIIQIDPFTLSYKPVIQSTLPPVKLTQPTPTFPPFPTFPPYTVKSTSKPPTRPYTFLPNIPPSIFPTFPPMNIPSQPSLISNSTTAAVLSPVATQTTPPLMPPIYPPTQVPFIFGTIQPYISPTTQQNHFPYPQSSSSIAFNGSMTRTAISTTTVVPSITSGTTTRSKPFNYVPMIPNTPTTNQHPPTAFSNTPPSNSTVPFIQSYWDPTTPRITKPTQKTPSPYQYQSRPPTLPPIAMTFPPDPPTVTNIRVITTTMGTRFIGSSTQRPQNFTSRIPSPTITPKLSTQATKIKKIALTCPPGNISIPGLTCDGVYKCPAGSNCYNSICCLSVERIQVPACPIDFLSLDPCPKPPEPDLCTMDQDCGPFMVCCLTSCDQRVCRPMVAPQQIIPR